MTVLRNSQHFLAPEGQYVYSTQVFPTSARSEERTLRRTQIHRSVRSSGRSSARGKFWCAINMSLLQKKKPTPLLDSPAMKRI